MHTKPLYSTKQLRLCEQQAIQSATVTADELMQRAGRAAWLELQTHYPHARCIAVYCGGGNNGGDGYVLAHLASLHGLSVTIYQSHTIDYLPLPAKNQANITINCGIRCLPLDAPLDDAVELIVDALIGIGIQNAVKAPMAETIDFINSANLPIISLDLPSGLNADTGHITGSCVMATHTVSFIGDKLGYYTADGPDYCGQIVCHSLDIGAHLENITNMAYLINRTALPFMMPKRPRNSHKGMFGHVLLIGGGHGMPGAIYLAALAAMRVGAGAVTIATRIEHAASVLPGLPEAMIYGIDRAIDLLPLLDKADVCVIGPGLGTDAWATTLYQTAITAQLPLVLDASALTLLAENPQHDEHWILTPHPGEAATLLNTTTTEIMQNRYEAAQSIQSLYGGSVILKGTGSIINSGRDVTVCADGNPGMASAGMGDVLSGVLAGLLAQGLAMPAAAKLGVCLHASAADDAVFGEGERGLMASDVVHYLRRLVNH